MNKSKIVWIIVVVIVVLGAWCWSSNKDKDVTPQPTGQLGLNGSTGQTNTGQETVTPVVTVASDPTLGDYLVATNGMTLYLYTKDTEGVSNCYDQCVVNWPLYVPPANEPLVAGAGITGKLSMITRKDGTTQLAYNNIPLYFWIKDKKVGDTTGQDVGKVWYVVKP